MTEPTPIAPGDKANIQAHAQPYIHKFHGKTMVIKYGGGMIRAQKLKMMDRTDPTIEYDVGQVGDIVSVDPRVVKAQICCARMPRH